MPSDGRVIIEHMSAPQPSPRLRPSWKVARRQRREGRPYKRIATELGISPSTVYLWTRDVELTEEQRERNRTGPGGPWNESDIRRRAYSWSLRCRNRRREHQREGRNRALGGDPVHLAGCMLYWAEGDKSRNTLGLGNSELPMMRQFLEFLHECFGVEPHRLALRLNVYLGNGMTITEIEDHWLQGLGLPRSVLRKHTINHLPTSSSGSRINKLPYGVCTVRVLESTAIVQHIFGAIQEYGGFEEPAWLD